MIFIVLMQKAKEIGIFDFDCILPQNREIKLKNLKQAETIKAVFLTRNLHT